MKIDVDKILFRWLLSHLKPLFLHAKNLIQRAEKAKEQIRRKNTNDKNDSVSFLGSDVDKLEKEHLRFVGPEKTKMLYTELFTFS